MQSVAPGPEHSVHAKIESSSSKPLQQKPPDGTNVEKTEAHVAAVHSVAPGPEHEVQESETTVASDAKS